MQTNKKQIHDWLKTIHVAFMPSAHMYGLLPDVVQNLKRAFARNGHVVSSTPTENTDVSISTGEFGKPISAMASATIKLRTRYRLNNLPSDFALVHLRTDAFESAIARLSHILSKPYVEQSDYRYPGLSPNAYKVLSQQGRRGGPILALARILQGQLMSIRVVLFVGNDRPTRAYHFDLVGSTACTRLHDNEDHFYDDIVHRMATTVSTCQVTKHNRSGIVLASSTWNALESVQTMCNAGREFNDRHFFTNAVELSDLIDLPTISAGIARQYSEGCYATWDVPMKSLVATITGAAKLVHKGSITRDDLVPIERINDTRTGVLYHEVEGNKLHPPSSEAYELLAIDELLSQIPCPLATYWGLPVPVIRSKLHGHRGIQSYDPRHVEYAPMDEAYFNYPVTCGTEAQALALRHAFSKALALNHPDDPRSIVFTILPCHGVLIVEKWRENKAPFQLIWEHMDRGSLGVEDSVPQATVRYEAAADGTLRLSAPVCIPERTDRRSETLLSPGGTT